MYFLVNASTPKLLDVAPSNFVPDKVTCSRQYWATFLLTLTPRSRSKVNLSLTLDVATSNFVPD